MVKNRPHFPHPSLAQANASNSGPLGKLPVRVITHNVRYASTKSERVKNERPWEERCPLIVNELRYHASQTITFFGGGVAFICLQECLHNQLHDILDDLNRHADEDEDVWKWDYIGVGRDDGKTEGEYSPILYPKTLLRPVHVETTWLSPTPDKPSKGWDAGSIRILTTGVFEHTFGFGQRVAVFNTHLDNEGSEARERSVPIILEKIEDVRQGWKASGSESSGKGLDFFLAGDFNSRPNMEAYRSMVASGMVVDAFEAVPKHKRYGDEVTFTGFTRKDDDGGGVRRIDFVWFGPKERVRERKGDKEGGWKVTGYSTLPNVWDAGVFSSDHRAVVADAVLL